MRLWGLYNIVEKKFQSLHKIHESTVQDMKNLNRQVKENTCEVNNFLLDILADTASAMIIMIQIKL